ncbi:flotillin-like protein 3 [Rhodamnia argentea]|uniref:Flotillin-like n=1 Tax=Rhodamnia argentea TaxID=178133 RepID=A0ABM3GYQ3_9MYRT|nr:flotillin-like protein 3 [Rhodamnia argentea]
MWCRLAGPFEYLAIIGGWILAITGGWIKDVKVVKVAELSPFQKCVKFDVSPVDYTFESLPFFRPAVFTIGPQVTNHQSLVRYANFFAFRVERSVHINDLVKGIIEGQTHILDASVTFQHILEGVSVEHILEEVFGKFFSKLQLELNQFGLVIFKAHLEYAGKTKMKGKVGAGQTKHNAVKINFETNGKMNVKVGVGQTKHDAVKTDFETKAKMMVKVGVGQTKHNAVKTDLVNKIMATGIRKVEIKETTTRVVKIFR